MTTLVPRKPYTNEELDKLYPARVELQLVQILLRHGERSPVSPRFQNAGLAPFWPYCRAANRFSSVIMANTEGTEWDKISWRRRLETFGSDDGPVIASGPGGELDAVCNLGELTDPGRATTLSLGQRIRHLYVDQLNFMPKLISDADMIYIRATPIPRALESVQQVFTGMYPLTARTASFPPPTIITRTPADETLFPNDGNCRRFSQLSRAFAERAADRWNETDEMDYVNKLISKWMPEYSKKVAVDSHPRLSGIMDTVNSTLAHSTPTRLPSEFYDTKLREIIDRVGTEEWYAGYKESTEYRALGIGGLLGDVVSRMIGSVRRNGNDGLVEVGGKDGQLGKGRGGETNLRMALSGCHDTTLAAVLASLGTFEGENGKWPPYTSHIAIELFRSKEWSRPRIVEGRTSLGAEQRTIEKGFEQRSWFNKLFAFGKGTAPPVGIERKRLSSYTTKEKDELDGFYVRLRYNDRPVVVPGCKPAGKHLDGDESFCTLAAFKSIVDKFTPDNWKLSCQSNLDKPSFPTKEEPAGYE